jgi:hypothetical protein
MSTPRISREEWQRRLRLCRKMIRSGKNTAQIRQEALVDYPDIAMQRRIMVANGEIVEGETGSYSSQMRSAQARSKKVVSGDNYNADLVDVFATPRSRKSISYFNNFD